MSDAKTSQLKGRQTQSVAPGTLATNEVKIILPQNATANLAQITPHAGLIAYDTDQQLVVFNDGTGFQPISSGGGGGADQSLSNLTSPTAINQDLNFSNSVGNINATGAVVLNGGDTNIAEIDIENGLIDLHSGVNGDGAVTIFSSDVSLFNESQASAPTLSLWNATEDNAVRLKAPDGLSVSSVLNLPSGVGSSGQALTTDGAGNLSWANSGVNQDLSNLTSPTAINQSLVFNTGADVTIKTKNASTGNSNNVSVLSGDSFLANSGNTSISTGTAPTGHTPGNVILTPGVAGSVRGKIQLKNGTEGVAGRVWTSTDTVGSGSWVAPASAGANDTLSNLTVPTAINTDLVFASSGAVKSPDSSSTTGNLAITTGTSSGADSGSISITTGSAGGNRGDLLIDANRILYLSADTTSTMTIGTVSPLGTLTVAGTNPSIAVRNTNQNYNYNLNIDSNSVFNIQDLNSGNTPFSIANSSNTGALAISQNRVDIGVRLHMNTQLIQEVGDPTSAQDAATKNYVDSKFTSGATGTFTSADAKTITVTNGIITSIV